MKVFSLALALMLSLSLSTASIAVAHEIPADVTIQAFLKPDGQRVQLLVRVPLEAMRDLSVPLTSSKTVELGRLRPLIAEGAIVWVGQNVDLFENDAPLATPSLLDLRVSLPTDRSFSSWETALAHVRGPELPDTTEIGWTTGVLDMLFTTPIRSAASQFSIQPHLARLGVR